MNRLSFYKYFLHFVLPLCLIYIPNFIKLNGGRLGIAAEKN